MSRQIIESTNHAARIRNRVTRNGKIRTETANRDDLNIAASTDPHGMRTKLFIDMDDGSLVLTGRQARTLYRVLSTHFESVER